MSFLSVAGATSAGAAGQKSPKAAASTVSGVRAGAVGQIPAANMLLPAAMALPTTLQVAAAPSNTATVYLIRNPGPSGTNGGYPVSTDDSATLLRTDGIASTIADDSTVGIAVDTAGTYTVRLGNGSDTTSATFTTTGAPASVSWAPTSQTKLVGETATMTLSLKDSAGSLTQAALGDTIAVAASGDDTPSDASVSAVEIYSGTAPITAIAQAGTQTITATPLGTMTSVAPASTSLTGEGSIAAIPVKNVEVTVPSNAVSVPANTDDTVDRAVAVPVGTSSLTVVLDDTAGNAANATTRWLVTLSSGTVTINGTAVASGATVDVLTVNRQASVSVTLGGAALATGESITLKQVGLSGSPLAGGTGLVVTQTASTASAATVTVSPDDSQIAALAATVPVTVTVTDQFGAPQSGWTVQAYRGASTTGGASGFISQGTTNASGQAAVTVTSATGATAPVTEQYSFWIVPIGQAAFAKNNPLQIQYTANGNITSLQVQANVGTPNPLVDDSAPVTAPLITVPFDGTASTTSSQTYTVATGAAVSGGTAGEVAQFKATPSQLTDITVSVPLGSTGIKVSKTAETLWSGGSSTITVSPDDTVYVFGTKVGEHSIQFSAGGKTVTAKVKVQTSANAAYNIEFSSVSEELEVGEFGQATVKITDVFGNAVPGADDTNAVTIAAEGAVRLGGFASTESVTPDANGEASVTVIAGATAGTGVLAVRPKLTSKAAAWQTGYTPPTGATAPVTSDAASITVKRPDADKVIEIVGIRGTVNGGSGVLVEGLTEGIDDGAKLVPFWRVPGATYTAGNARPEVTDSEFSWSRKMGKTAYVFFTTEDGAVKSNRVIIAGK